MLLVVVPGIAAESVIFIRLQFSFGHPDSFLGNKEERVYSDNLWEDYRYHCNSLTFSAAQAAAWAAEGNMPLLLPAFSSRMSTMGHTPPIIISILFCTFSLPVTSNGAPNPFFQTFARLRSLGDGFCGRERFWGVLFMASWNLSG